MLKPPHIRRSYQSHIFFWKVACFTGTKVICFSVGFLEYIDPIVNPIVTIIKHHHIKAYSEFPPVFRHVLSGSNLNTHRLPEGSYQFVLATKLSDHSLVSQRPVCIVYRYISLQPIIVSVVQISTGSSSLQENQENKHQLLKGFCCSNVKLKPIPRLKLQGAYNESNH